MAVAASPRARASSPREKRSDARSGAVPAASASSCSSSTPASAAPTSSSGEVHADRQLEAGRAAQALAGRQRAQVAGDQIACARRVAAVEGDLGEAQLRGGMPRDALAQLRGLVQAALPPAQLRQAQDALEDQRRRARARTPARRPSSSASASFHRPRRISTDA